MAGITAVNRCAWLNSDPLYIDYHDREWGVPIHTNDRALFECLLLEGAQAGLSWYTILKKRSAYRAAFADFDPQRMVDFTPEHIAALATNPGIVRHRGKISAFIGNARAYLDMCDTGLIWHDHLWSFVEGRSIVNHWQKGSEVPAKTSQSEAMSKDLQQRGFKFTGPTICYAFMQAVGMVNDHVVSCFRHSSLDAGSKTGQW